MSHRAKIAALLALLLGLLVPVKAGENEVYIRMVQVLGTGSRGDQPADVDKALEPLRGHLERATRHARYSLIGRSTTKKGAFGEAVTFDLAGQLRAQAVASSESGDRIRLVLQVNKRGKKDEMVFETKLKMKDGATAVPVIEKALEGGDLLLAVTVSRESL